MTEIRTRRLGPGDHAQARQLFAHMAEWFGEEHAPLGDDYLDRLLVRDDFWAFAALRGDELVGGLTAHTLPMTRSEAAEVFVYDVAVRERDRRQGIGRALLDAVRGAALAAGIQTVFVAVDAEDVHALEFYRAFGGAASPVTLFVFEASGSPAR